jgi:IMP dehydrogenase
MNRALTFDDVALVPQYNNVPSRTEPTLETWLTKKIKIGIPIVAANMDTVIGDNLAEVLVSYGSTPIFHRFCSFAQKDSWAKRFPQCFISYGLSQTDLEIIHELYKTSANVCFDIAHGHCERMLKAISETKELYPNVQIIAGNVCTPQAVHDLHTAGADAVKVGIGPGAACTTRSVTGFGVPQFTAIQECARMGQKLRIPIIADGGIRTSRDLVLAVASGASSVMIGKLFALTTESAAEKRQKLGTTVLDNGYIFEAKYRGQASADFQNSYFGGLKAGTVPEGESFWAPVTGSAKDMLEQLCGGLRSGLTYGGARSIPELQRKAEFVEVTPTYHNEMAVRK